MRNKLFTIFLGFFLLYVVFIYPLDRTLCKVIRVIDGDTIEVDINGKIEKVRLIGIDTPELNRLQKQAEYFAKESYEYTKQILEDKNIYLENDSQSLNRDKYNRLLRYVWIDDSLFNANIISDGYAHVYTKFPFDRLEEFRKLEAKAREDKKGLWGKDAKAVSIKKENDLKNTIVCITRTGSKYHRCSCSYLRKSSIPIKLIDAINRGYTPCSRCRPPTLN